MPATEMYDSGDSSPVVVCRNKISASDYIDQDGSMDLDRIAHKTHPGALLLQKLGHGLSGSLSKLHPGGHNHNSSSQNLNNHTTFNTMVPPAMATFPFQQATAGLGGAAAVPMPEPLNTAGSRMSWSSPQPPMGPSVSPHIQPRPAGVTAPMMHMAQAQTKPLPIARGTQQMGSGDSWLSFGADAGTQSPQSLPRSFPGSGLSLNTLDEGFQRLITSPRMAGAHAAYCSAGGSAQQMMDLPQAQLTDPWETSGIDDSYYQTNPGRPPYSFASLICKAIIANAKQNPNSQGASLKGIYQWIEANFLFYRKPGPAAQSWRSSIRHNLVFNRAFVKKEIEEDGKKNIVWLLSPNVQVSSDGVLITRRSIRKRINSAPSSPPSQAAFLQAVMTGMATPADLKQLHASKSDSFADNMYGFSDTDSMRGPSFDPRGHQMPGMMPLVNGFAPRPNPMMATDRPRSTTGVMDPYFHAGAQVLRSPDIMSTTGHEVSPTSFTAPNGFLGVSSNSQTAFNGSITRRNTAPPEVLRPAKPEPLDQTQQGGMTAHPKPSINSKLALLAELDADPSIMQMLLKM